MPSGCCQPGPMLCGRRHVLLRCHDVRPPCINDTYAIPAQEANRKHDLSLVEYLVKEVFFYVGLEHLKMSIQLRRHPTIQARCTLS